MPPPGIDCAGKAGARSGTAGDPPPGQPGEDANGGTRMKIRSVVALTLSAVLLASTSGAAEKKVYLHSVPIHLLPITKSTYKSPKYQDNATIRKWKSWVDMQEKYFRNDQIKPVLVIDWDDMKKPYLLEVMGSGILVDMVLDSVKGMPSAEAAAKAQRRVEELLVQTGYLKK
jgi:hypothetical protein